MGAASLKELGKELGLVGVRLAGRDASEFRKNKTCSAALLAQGAALAVRIKAPFKDMPDFVKNGAPSGMLPETPAVLRLFYRCEDEEYQPVSAALIPAEQARNLTMDFRETGGMVRVPAAERPALHAAAVGLFRYIAGETGSNLPCNAWGCDRGNGRAMTVEEAYIAHGA